MKDVCTLGILDSYRNRKPEFDTYPLPPDTTVALTDGSPRVSFARPGITLAIPVDVTTAMQIAANGSCNATDKTDTVGNARAMIMSLK